MTAFFAVEFWWLWASIFVLLGAAIGAAYVRLFVKRRSRHLYMNMPNEHTTKVAVSPRFEYFFQETFDSLNRLRADIEELKQEQTLLKTAVENEFEPSAEQDGGSYEIKFTQRPSDKPFVAGIAIPESYDLILPSSTIISRSEFPSPDPAPEPPKADPRIVNVFFATNRHQVDPFSEPWFTTDRSRNLSLGVAGIRIPENHSIGKVEMPFQISLFGKTIYEAPTKPHKHFTTAFCKIYSEVAWMKSIQYSDCSEVFLFVHGYNTSFQNAIYRGGQMAWDLGLKGVPVVFSWPSGEGVLKYLYDKDSALGAKDAFLECLTMLKSIPTIQKIHLLAHSMGNLLVLEALASNRYLTKSFQIAELMLAAPDVDRDNFELLLPKIQHSIKNVTLYASSRDKALATSKKLAGNIPRAGDVSRKGPIILPGMETIDVTSLGGELLGLNHSTFAENHSILSDVSILIQESKRPPHKRLTNIRGVPEIPATPTYWKYIKA